MEWTQFLILIITISGLFLWSRSESRADSRRCEDLIEAIKQDLKDFHGKLCALQEKYLQSKEKK